MNHDTFFLMICVLFLFITPVLKVCDWITSLASRQQRDVCKLKDSSTSCCSCYHIPNMLQLLDHISILVNTFCKLCQFEVNVQSNCKPVVCFHCRLAPLMSLICKCKMSFNVWPERTHWRLFSKIILCLSSLWLMSFSSYRNIRGKCLYLFLYL